MPEETVLDDEHLYEADGDPSDDDEAGAAPSGSSANPSSTLFGAVASNYAQLPAN